MASSTYWHTARRLRASRRQLLAGAAAGGAGLVALACSSSTNKSASPAGNTAPGNVSGTAAAKQPKKGGTLIHEGGNGIFASGVDPHTTGNSYSGIMSTFYQNLVRHNPTTFNLEPELAQKWEQPDQTTYVMHLAPNVKWHNKAPANGRAFTANDAVFSLKRIGSNDPKFVNKALVGGLDQITAPDNTTLRLTTKVADVTTLVNLADWSALMLAPEVVDKAGKFNSADVAVGTGAFMVQAYDDTSATLVRNPDYWKPGLPYLDGMRVINIQDTSSQWAAFLSGQLDVVTVPGQQAAQFLADKSGKYQSGWFRDVAVQNLWQNTRVKPFDDARVTHALRLLIDHQEYIKAWVEAFFGPGSGQYTSALPEASREWDFTPDEYAKQFLEWKQPKDDAAKEALSLLSAAGFTASNPLKFELTGNNNADWTRALTELAQAQWKRLSNNVVQAEIKTVDNSILNGVLAQHQFQVAGPSARGSYFDPGQIFSDQDYSKGGRNFGGFNDPAIDAKIEKQQVTFDAAQRKPLIKEILTDLINKSPYTSPCSRNMLSARQSKIQNLVPEMSTGVFGFQYESVWFNA
jgi:peptide/nickel transport system substrate-binding protein